MNVLVVLGPASMTDASYSGLRLVTNLAQRVDVAVRIFCIGDAIDCAIAQPQLPDGYYHLDHMLAAAAHHGAEISLCGTCMDARGITDTMLIPAAHSSTHDELTDWARWADTSLNF